MDLSKPLVLIGLGVAFLGVFMAGAVMAPFADGSAAAARVPAQLSRGEGSSSATAGDGAWLGASNQVARADSESEALDLAAIRAVEASAEIAAESASTPASSEASAKPLSSAAITGVVRDIAGQPIAGVLVRARPSGENYWRERQLDDMAQWPRDGSPPPVDLQRMLRQAAQQFARNDGKLREVTTDEQGAYRLEGLSAESWRIEAYAKGWRLRSTISEDPRAWPGQKIDFAGTRLERLSIAVKDPSGAPLARACIDVITPNQGEEQRLWTQEDPWIWMPPGSYSLRARSKPGQGPSSETVAVAVDPGVAPPTVELVLREEARVVGVLSGEVVTRFGSRSLSVEVQDGSAVQGMEWEYYNGSGRRGRSVEIEEIDGELRYRATGLKPGKHKLRVRLARGLLLHEREIDVPSGELRVDLELALDAGARVLEAVILDGAGLVQLDASLRVQARGERGPGESVVCVSAGEGRWWLVHSAKLMEKANEGSFVAHAQSPRLGPLQQSYKPLQEERLELRYSEPAFLLVRMSGPAPKGVMIQVALQVERTNESEPQEEEPSSMLGDSTELAFGPLRTGRYKLIVRGSQRDWNFFPLHEEMIELRSGRQERSVPLPELHTINVRVADAQQGQSYRGSVWRADDPSSSFRTSFSVTNGVGELAGLPTGRYEAELQERGPGGARRETFSVPGTAELVFGPANPNATPKLAVRVDLQDPAGRAARAGLAQGDLIVGIGGKRFEKIEEVQPRFSGAPYYLSGGTIPLDVERSGSVLRIDVEVDVLMYQQNSGVRFRTPGR
ncbi:MAG: carboxypeptidase regulatory-like domain-containing protein [Planctomycetes bacterium]|nr:carboxypeptidase regulatory-like domain-containing protein [Planctomycetota bacterium]